jgi:hypothetical protein
LKLFYSEFIKNNKSELFVFGLDSLHFQSKLIDIEYDDMKRIFLAINNRMYCEYFKLYKIIVSYISENTFDKKIMELIKVNNFPVYKDLEPFKEYDFEKVLEIHENIVLMLNAIIGYLEGKKHELSFHIIKQNIGLNIDNFISSFNFDITVIREKINMFITYIEFFHKLHTKQLQRFSNKIQLMCSHVNKDIRFDDTIDIKNKKNYDSESEKREKSPIKNKIIDNLSDTDNDSISSFSNQILSLTNTHDELDEAFSNIDSKCDLILNSTVTVTVNVPENDSVPINDPVSIIDPVPEILPGVTIEQIIEVINEVKNEVKNEVIINEVIINEVIINEVIINEIVANEIVANEIVANEIVANENKVEEFFSFKPFE